MLEERAEGLIFLHRAGQLGEILEPTGGFGAALGLEDGGIARFIEDDAGEFGVGEVRRRSPPSVSWR